MQVIFYVGKAYPHADTLRNLRRNGYELGLFRDTTQALSNVDVFKHVIELDFSSEQDFRRSLRQTKLPKIDGLVCTHENYILFKAIAAEVLSLPAISTDSARYCTDKFAMRTRFLEYAPHITPRFALVASENQLLDFAHSTNYPLIIKPTALIKSLLVSKCNDEHELLNAYRSASAQINDMHTKLHITTRPPAIIVEEFISGQMCSIAAFVDHDGTIQACAGIAALTTAQDVGFNDSFLYARKLDGYSPAMIDAIMQTASDGVQALSMRSTAAHIEIIHNEKEAKIVEIGARIGGYRPFLYQTSYGIDMIQQEINVALGEPIDVSGQFKRYSALYELFPSGLGSFVQLEALPSPETFDYFNQVAKPGDVVGQAKNGYGSAAIIGISDADEYSFKKKCTDVERIRVTTR